MKLQIVFNLSFFEAQLLKNKKRCVFAHTPQPKVLI